MSAIYTVHIHYQSQPNLNLQVKARLTTNQLIFIPPPIKNDYSPYLGKKGIAIEKRKHVAKVEEVDQFYFKLCSNASIIIQKNSK